MEEQVTIEEVLNGTANILRSIQVPVELAEQIGIPVLKAIRNLNACVQAIESTPKKTDEAEETAKE